MKRHLHGFFGASLMALILSLGLACNGNENTGGQSGGGSSASGSNLFTNFDALNLVTHRYVVQDKPIYEDYERQAQMPVEMAIMNGKQIVAAAEAGRLNGGDMVIVDNFYDMHRLIQSGVLDPFNVDIFGDRIPSRFVDNEGYWSALSRWTMSFIFRDDVVDFQKMKRYAGVLDPAYKGRVVMSHPDSSGLVTVVAYMIGIHGQEAASVFLQTLANNLAEPPSGNDVDQIRKVISGQADIAFINGSEFMRYRYSGNPQYYQETDGLVIEVPIDANSNNYYDITAVGILKGAPDRHYAMSMVEFLSVKKHQDVYPHAMFEYPVNIFSQELDFLLDIDGLPQGEYSPETAEDQLDEARNLIRIVFDL